MFAEAFIKHLPRNHSNHTPLLLTLDSHMIPQPQATPFRFQKMWCLHPTFDEAINSFWQDSTADIVHKLEDFQKFLKKWNNSVFGDLFRRKTTILNRLQGTSQARNTYNNGYLNQIEQARMDEYYLLLNQEEEFWRQKSRVQWLASGDLKSHFFHTTTLNTTET